GPLRPSVLGTPRGVSIVVRCCIHKPTSQEHAVKVNVTSGGSFTPEEVQELREATLKEVDILHKVSGHPNIKPPGVPLLRI
uniref:Uncharacterized protein n=1 Tax=Pongo abelii TaxID=9601 RepID=A0A8I5TEH4_PONAB